jgi:hypothetical protein
LAHSRVITIRCQKFHACSQLATQAVYTAEYEHYGDYCTAHADETLRQLNEMEAEERRRSWLERRQQRKER